MIVRVNKNTGTQKPVKYAILSSGTISHVWCDDESNIAPKRRNRIQLTSEKALVIKPSYDA